MENSGIVVLASNRNAESHWFLKQVQRFKCNFDKMMNNLLNIKERHDNSIALQNET